MFKRCRYNVLIALLIGSVSACSPPSDRRGLSDQTAGSETADRVGHVESGLTALDPALARQQTMAMRVEIIRDDFGVAHIYGESDADAVFGLLYAQAEDDFTRVEMNYIRALGRLAELKGESALFHDLRARLFMTEAEAKLAYQQAPAWLKALCLAFADGLNFYLHSNPSVKPVLLERFEPWMPMFFFEGSIGGDIEKVSVTGIKALYDQTAAELLAGPQPVLGDHTSTPSPAQSATPARLAKASAQAPDRAEPAGSNGIAIAPSLSASGNALLLINPHTSFYFRGEYHIASDSGLNAYGAVTWGQFFIYQGFNAYNGWMHSSTYADFMDAFVEDVTHHAGGLHYRYGDELRPVTVNEVSLDYLDKSGQGEAVMRSRQFPLLRTHHGPITHRVNSAWAATALNWQPAKALEQAWRRTQQTSLTGFESVLGLRTNSSNNTIYADSVGNIAYYHGNFIPRRRVDMNYSKAVDGSDPSTDWQGLHEVDETVHLINPAVGWLQNCNSTPFTVAGPDSPSPDDYPRYMAPDPENYRGVHAATLLSDISRDRDDKLSLDELIALAYHPELPAFHRLIPDLVADWKAAQAYQNNPAGASIEPVISLLADWDRTADARSTALTIAHFYGLALLSHPEKQPDESSMEWLERSTTALPGTARLVLLANVVDDLSQRYGDWKVAWGDINRLQRLSGDIDARFSDDAPSLPVGLASGRWGALAAFGAKRQNTDKLYGYRGNSFVAVVEFGNRIRALSLLVGGQSSDSQSPHFFDQASRYVKRRFKAVAFYRDDVEAVAQRRYHPG